MGRSNGRESVDGLGDSSRGRRLSDSELDAQNAAATEQYNSVALSACQVLCRLRTQKVICVPSTDYRANKSLTGGSLFVRHVSSAGEHSWRRSLRFIIEVVRQSIPPSPFPTPSGKPKVFFEASNCPNGDKRDALQNRPWVDCEKSYVFCHDV